jgi:hypothetical protein
MRSADPGEQWSQGTHLSLGDFGDYDSVLWEALQVDMCNKSKLIISWGEQQLCLHLYGVVSTLPSGPSRSVRLENLLIVYLKQLLNPSINALKIYLMPFFWYIYSFNKPFLMFSVSRMLASRMQRWTRHCLYNEEIYNLIKQVRHINRKGKKYSMGILISSILYVLIPYKKQNRERNRYGKWKEHETVSTDVIYTFYIINRFHLRNPVFENKWLYGWYSAETI